MPFNKKINGFQNEYEFVNYLNGKIFKNMEFIFQDLLNELYGEIDDWEMITCWVNYKAQKSDIYIKINDCIKTISIKKGVKNSVHVEHFDSFVNFFYKIGADARVIFEIMRFQYADGTLNGTGKHRISSEEYKKKYKYGIDYVNEKINTDDIIAKCIDRFVLYGNNSDKPIDAIIYGVVEDFIWITSDEIKKVILKNKSYQATGIHIGSLYYQPLNRCLNYNKKYEDKRNYIQIKWYNISDDIIYIMNERFIQRNHGRTSKQKV